MKIKHKFIGRKDWEIEDFKMSKSIEAFRKFLKTGDITQNRTRFTNFSSSYHNFTKISKRRTGTGANDK